MQLKLGGNRITSFKARSSAQFPTRTLVISPDECDEKFEDASSFLLYPLCIEAAIWRYSLQNPLRFTKWHMSTFD
jgi:hypothetical protein